MTNHTKEEINLHLAKLDGIDPESQGKIFEYPLPDYTARENRAMLDDLIEKYYISVMSIFDEKYWSCKTPDYVFSSTHKDRTTAIINCLMMIEADND